jgi:hypothetical protein
MAPARPNGYSQFGQILTEIGVLPSSPSTLRKTILILLSADLALSIASSRTLRIAGDAFPFAALVKWTGLTRNVRSQGVNCIKKKELVASESPPLALFSPAPWIPETSRLGFGEFGSTVNASI